MRVLESTVDDQKQQIIELEDELQAAENARSRLEVNMTVLKQDMARAIEDNATESLRSMTNQLRIYQSKLQEENVSKQRLDQYVKTLELDLQDIRQQHDQAKKECSEAKLVNRRMQVNSFVLILPELQSIVVSFQAQVRENTRELQEIRQKHASATDEQRDWQSEQRKLRSSLETLTSEKDLLARQLRQSQSERSELEQTLAQNPTDE